MNRASRTIAVVSIGAAAMRLACAGEMNIVKDGRSEYVIAVPGDEAVAGMVREAAEALRGYLLEATGCPLPIVSEDEVGERPAFYLGRTRKGEAVGVPYAKLTDYVHCRKMVGRDIFLAGNDADGGIRGPLQPHDREYLCSDFGLNADVKDLSYRRWHGTLKAVLAFLERENVVRFLMPGPNGRNVRKAKTLAVSDDGDFLKENAIPYSNCHCYGDLHTTVALGHLEIPYNKTWGGHPFPEAVPRTTYEKTHPEYFIMKDGVRRPDFGPAEGGHPCVSNPEVFELFMAEMKRQYDIGFRWIQVGPTDGQVACECDECRKMHPDPKERQWLFNLKVAKAAKERLPGAKMVLLSYDFTAEAPKSFDKFPDNVVVELCIWKNFKEKFEDWARFKDVPKIAYLYFFGLYHTLQIAPTRTPKYIANAMKILADNNVRCIFKCGWAEDLGLEGHIAYVFSRLLEDPSRAPGGIGDEFCDLAYGKASMHMKKFYSNMYAYLDTVVGHSVIDELRERPHNPGRMFEVAYRPDTMSGMETHLARAEAVKGLSSKERARLALTRRSFDFLKARTKCFYLQEAWSVTKAPEILDVAERTSVEMDAMLDKWYGPDGKMIRPEGFDWHYIRNLPRERLVGGGGAMLSAVPSLFRNGPGGWRALKAKAASGK